jgi:hypothetical protein
MANLNEIPYNELIDAPLDEGTTSSTIGKRLTKLFKKQS